MVHALLVVFLVAPQDRIRSSDLVIGIARIGCLARRKRDHRPSDGPDTVYQVDQPGEERHPRALRRLVLQLDTSHDIAGVSLITRAMGVVSPDRSEYAVQRKLVKTLC